METIIRNMIESANIHHDYQAADYIYLILSELADTCNCPSNWRDLGEKFAEEYDGNDWVFENCRLYNFA